MARLRHDRYLERSPDRTWDLATGDTVARAVVDRRRPAEDSTRALLAEVLDHGRDGTPRRLAIGLRPGRGLAEEIDAVADDARSRGFVAIGVEVYLRFRRTLGEDLQDRALVLIAAPGVEDDRALYALVNASAQSSRPHVLLTLTAEGTHAWTDATPRVHEARAVYGAGPRRTATTMTLPEDVVRHLERRARAIEFAHSGRHAAADRLLRDVAAALVTRRACAAAGETYVMLGRQLLERGRAADADAVFGEAVMQAEATGAEPLTLTARVWQAAARTDRGQLTAAESICRAVLMTGSLSAG